MEPRDGSPPPGPTPTLVDLGPSTRHQLLPSEVVDWSELCRRFGPHDLRHHYRTEFHQLVLCTAGVGTHIVDDESVEMTQGVLLRIHPDQVQQFVKASTFEATTVVWPRQSHREDRESSTWRPGSDATTHWQLDSELFAKISASVRELQSEQERFDGSPSRIKLLRAMLATLLLRLAIEIPDSSPRASRLPRPYLEFRELIEERLYDRPTIVTLAQDLGYSARTLNRACEHVSGKTAKQTLDERVAWEIQRQLTHTNRTIAGIASDFGFADSSNFTKFVKRQLGDLPRQIREKANR